MTQWFDPEPTFKGLVFAEELVRQGFQVTVITGFPNYPGGKVYPGYRIKLIEKQLINGVSVIRLPLYPSHDQSAVKRMLNYASFSISILVYGLIYIKQKKVIYAYHPPLSIGLAVTIIRFFKKSRVIYDIQDMWPDTLHATRMLNNRFFLALIGQLCLIVYQNVDEITVLSPGFKSLLIERGVPEKKIHVIYNWADESSLNSINANKIDKNKISGVFKIIFAGNMGKAQGLGTIIDAAVILKRRGSPVQFIMIGGGVEVNKLQDEAFGKNLDNIQFLPPVPMSEVGHYLHSADALMVHLRKDPLFRITIPSKTQAYMCVGKPILMAVDGDAADLVRGSDGGVVAESENPNSLADAADYLAGLPDSKLAEIGDCAKSYYITNLSLHVGVSHFAAIFRRYL